MADDRSTSGWRARLLEVGAARQSIDCEPAARWLEGLESCQERTQSQLIERRPFNLVEIALANKLARTVWALVAQGRGFDRQWHSTLPGQALVPAAL